MRGIGRHSQLSGRDEVVATAEALAVSREGDDVHLGVEVRALHARRDLRGISSVIPLPRSGRFRVMRAKRPVRSYVIVDRRSMGTHGSLFSSSWSLAAYPRRAPSLRLSVVVLSVRAVLSSVLSVRCLSVLSVSSAVPCCPRPSSGARLATSDAMPNEAPSPVAAPSDDPPRARALREYLVDRIVALGVRDARVLRAMRGIPRHLFAPEYDLGQAYGDYPLSIGHEATISQPSLVGIMSEALELSGHERVLEIGTGSGYQTAVLCRLAGHVDTVELVPELAQRAASTLSALGCTNVDIHTSDGWTGWPEGAPYDRVVVTAAPEVFRRPSSTS